MGLEEFYSRFVVGLGGDRRYSIWADLVKHVCEPLRKHGVCAELWLDGSFITRCPEPDDIDGSLMILSDHIDVMSQDALDFLKQFDDAGPAFPEWLDLFLCPVYPRGHLLRGDLNDPDGWARQWSLERNSNWLKGFVTIPFG